MDFPPDNLESSHDSISGIKNHTVPHGNFVPCTLPCDDLGIFFKKSEFIYIFLHCIFLPRVIERPLVVIFMNNFNEFNAPQSLPPSISVVFP